MRRVVVKVGSAVVAPGGRIDGAAVGRICDELAALARAGVEPVLVSSGAVAAGFRALGLAAMPDNIRQKQAAAAVGQPAMMRLYADRLGVHGLAAAQVLLTTDDFGHRERFLNARHTLETLVSAGVLPVVNENDSVVFDEIKLGDNDRLGALVAGAVGADLLVMLSVAPGLVDLGTGAVIPSVRNIEEARFYVDATRSSGVGTGGMATKLDAAAIAGEHGVPAFLTRGPTDDRPDPIARAIAGSGEGTLFEPGPRAGPRARKSWIAHATKARGLIVVDDGAARAVRERGASLLPGGIVRVEGRFEPGSAVDIAGRDGRVVARGLSSYGSADIERIKGSRSDAITGILGYAYADEVVHRDDMQVMGDAP